MFTLSPLFGDHAVIPMDKEWRIFGMAKEGEAIQATLTNQDGAITGEDGIFHPAQAELDRNRIHLTSDAVPHPVAARYAWVNYGEVHVFSRDGRQPLAPFVLE